MAPLVYWTVYAATQTVIGAFLFKVALTMAITAVSRALFAPKVPTQSPMLRDRTLTVREPLSVRRILYGTVRVGGTIVYIETTGNNKYLHLVVAFAGHEIEEFSTFYLDNRALTLDGNNVTAPSRFADRVWVYPHLGTDSQTADAVLSAASGTWGSAHRLRGIAYAYIKMEYNQDAFPNGIPNITALVKGKKVYDPRTGTTAWSNNAALCAADYLTDTRLGLGVPLGEVNAATLTAAADTCDENVALAAGGSEDRYTCNGAVELDATPREIIEALATAKAAPTVYCMGQWYVYAGEWRTPAVAFDENDLRGPLRVSSRQPRRELFNSVKGTYAAPSNDWQLADFPAVSAASYVTEDGEQLWNEVRLPFTTTPSRAQRIAKIEIMRARRQITVQAPFKLNALRVVPGSVITLNVERLGWVNKTFEVTDWEFAQDESLALGVNLTLRETDANVYEWDTGDESTALPAQTTNLPDPFTVAAPTGIYAEPGTALTDGGDTIYKVNIGWTPPDDQFVLSGGMIEVQYKRSADTRWRPSWFVDGAETETEVYQLSAGVLYDVRIRGYNKLARSSWTSLYGFTIAGGGALVQVDYGAFVGDAVTVNLDYGAFVGDAVTVNTDYGSFV